MRSLRPARRASRASAGPPSAPPANRRSGTPPNRRRGHLRRAEECRLGQQRAERLGLERMPLRASLVHLELVEDLLCLRFAGLCLPLGAQPRIELVEAIVGVEDATDDELRRHRSVPVILLQAERNVITSLAPVAVELGSLPKRDRAAGIAAVQLYTETEMLAVADRCKLAELAAGRQQGHVGVGQTERRQRAQLFAELERELRPARKNCVDDGR